MYDLCLQEAEAGRVPASIEFAHVELPKELNERLTKARRKASREVSRWVMTAQFADDVIFRNDIPVSHSLDY